MLDFKARYYDPALGRFAAADTIIPQGQGAQAWDRYAYASNSPVNRVDPSGHFDNCSAITSKQCAIDNAWTLDVFTQQIKAEYGITLKNGSRNWDLQNAKIVYQGLGDTYSPLFNTQGVTFTLNTNPGHYGGVTSGTNIDFNTSTTIPIHNFYHEYGHLLDNLNSDRFSNALAGQVRRGPDGKYWFGGSNDGVINPDITLKSDRVFDPNWGTVDAIQAYPDTRRQAIEQWADMYANYMSGNIDTGQPAGFAMSAFVQGYLYPPPYIPGGGF